MRAQPVCAWDSYKDGQTPPGDAHRGTTLTAASPSVGSKGNIYARSRYFIDMRYETDKASPTQPPEQPRKNRGTVQPTVYQRQCGE